MFWYNDLCEYYNVTPENAIALSERSSGRKPSFPGSPTCEPVSGKTWEELWHDKPRETIEQKIAFYKDIGAWQSFRQCNYRKDFPYQQIYQNFCKPDASILEYGCGVAPMSSFAAKAVGDNHQLKFTLVEVPSEHYEFGKWRLKKHAPKTSFDFIEITHENLIPEFKTNFDLICMMDVLEHLPNPYDVMTNIIEHCNPNAILIETWVDHGDDGPGESDLEEAEAEREVTQNLISEKFTLVHDAGGIRFHQYTAGLNFLKKDEETNKDGEHIDGWLNE